jgi:membrane-associated phospholipid phosphatase
MKASSRKGNHLTLSKRVLLALLVCGIELLYIPTSNRLTGGIEPKLPIDIFPIWPIWVLPYVLCYVLWVSGFIWITLKMDDDLFRAFIMAGTLTFAIGVTTFIFFPTYVKATPLQGHDVFTFLLNFIHGNWGRYDAFPSGHVYITTLLALFFSRWYPRWKPLWIVTIVIVAFSTLFTGQHYVLDVIGGYLAALAGYHFGLWWAGLTPAAKRLAKRPRERVISSSD